MKRVWILAGAGVVILALVAAAIWLKGGTEDKPVSPRVESESEPWPDWSDDHEIAESPDPGTWVEMETREPVPAAEPTGALGGPAGRRLIRREDREPPESGEPRGQADPAESENN